jgi:hypothetical protein
MESVSSERLTDADVGIGPMSNRATNEVARPQVSRLELACGVWFY